MNISKLKDISKYYTGSNIHIKKKNKMKFTEYCNGEVTQNCIDKAKNSGNPTLKKRAIFAESSRSWKHAKGGQLIPKHKIGYILDYDPKNPYHVHSNGEKIVITPEQYEKHKDEPYFANIRKQVEEHQAAYPEPEYTETPNPEYRRVYENVKAASNQHINEHKFSNQIYKGYTPVPYPYMRNSVDGVVTDKEGNLYRPMTVADAGKGVTPMFTTTERNRTHGHEYDMQWVRVKTPAKTIKTLKQPLPINRTYNVDEELNNSVNEYITNPNNIVNILPVTLPHQLQKKKEILNNGNIKLVKTDEYEPGTFTKANFMKEFKPYLHPDSYEYLLNDSDLWQSPTKQQALNNIQLKIN